MTARAEPRRAAPAQGGSDRAASLTLAAQIALRELVLAGELKAGERVSELQMVERLAVSRTPVRAALVRLQDEGLLEALPSGGFAVKSFSEREVFEAVEIRGTLEGLAVRLAAERGVGRAELAQAAALLDDIDGIVQPDRVEVDFSAYVALNAGFHDMLTAFAAGPALARQIQRANALPFASPSALVMLHVEAAVAHRILTVAQDHHRCILAAIERREGARAEAIMREHARIAHRSLERAFANSTILRLVPGSALITRSRSLAKGRGTQGEDQQ